MQAKLFVPRTDQWPVSDWHWEPHPDDLLDDLPPEARVKLDQLAREITVRDSSLGLADRLSGQPNRPERMKPTHRRSLAPDAVEFVADTDTLLTMCVRSASSNHLRSTWNSASRGLICPVR